MPRLKKHTQSSLFVYFI